MPKVPEHMTYRCLCELRREHAAWRLLAADQAPLAAAFFYREFIAGKRRGVEVQQLAEDLEDFMYDAAQRDRQPFGRSPQEYLEIWTDADHGWLRKYEYNDEWYYDLTAAAQKAVEWLSGLKPQEFVGTESRLRTVFSLLQEIERETDLDAEHRLAYLHERQREIEAEISEIIRTGVVRPRLDEVQIKERFLQAEKLATDILADFREVEDNFRALTRQVQDQAVSWTRGKGELLEKIFQKSDLIRSSDQGRSFNAFWRYLMAPGQREVFHELLQHVSESQPVRELLAEHPLGSVQREWVQAAGRVQKTLAQLSAQLRRYVDEDYLREEKAIYELIAQVEQQAVYLREQEAAPAPREEVALLEAAAPDIAFPLERPLFAPPQHTRLQDAILGQGEAAAEEELSALYAQSRVDREKLAGYIREMLKERPEVSLSEVVAAHPLTQGLTELLAYVLLASRRQGESFQPELERIMYARDGRELAATCEKITFRRD